MNCRMVACSSSTMYGVLLVNVSECGRASPLRREVISILYLPFVAWYDHFFFHHPPSTIHHPPSTIHHPSSIIHHPYTPHISCLMPRPSPTPTPHTPHSPLLTPHSSLLTPHSSLLTPHSYPSLPSLSPSLPLSLT